jgi:benzil reductase ((S)-benzoin forming)
MKEIIITGVSRGLGKEILKLILPSASRVVCIGRKLPQIEDRLIQKAIFIRQDMAEDFRPFSSSDLGIDDNIQEVVFINNAATIEPVALIGTLNPSDVNDSIRINVTYPAFLTNNLVSICEERNIRLRILNISTGAAQKAFAGWALYCATKAAVRMFFDCLALQSGNITVKHIDPGVMDTEMQNIIRHTPKEIFPAKDIFLEYKAKHVLRQPSDVAKEILANEGCL